MGVPMVAGAFLGTILSTMSAELAFAGISVAILPLGTSSMRLMSYESPMLTIAVTRDGLVTPASPRPLNVYPNTPPYLRKV